MRRLLREVRNVRQIPGDPRRRWFCSEALDLLVWFSSKDKLVGFQLCSRKRAEEHALTWRAGTGFEYASVDSGEQHGPLAYKGTPILRPNGAFDLKQLQEAFGNAAVELPAGIRCFISQALASYPRNPGSPLRRRKSPAARRLQR